MIKTTDITKMKDKQIDQIYLTSAIFEGTTNRENDSSESNLCSLRLDQRVNYEFCNSSSNINQSLTAHH